MHNVYHHHNVMVGLAVLLIARFFRVMAAVFKEFLVHVRNQRNVETVTPAQVVNVWQELERIVLSTLNVTMVFVFQAQKLVN